MLKVGVVMRQHNICCVYVCFVWRGMAAYTICYAAASPH